MIKFLNNKKQGTDFERIAGSIINANAMKTIANYMKTRTENSNKKNAMDKEEEEMVIIWTRQKAINMKYTSQETISLLSCCCRDIKILIKVYDVACDG